MPSILIADDSKEVRTVLHDAFTQFHFTTVIARDGEEALTLFCLHVPDLVIIDILMPRIEGLETIIHIREVNNMVPIIAITGGDIGEHADLLSLAQKAGATRAIQKPFDVITLRESILTDYFPTHTISPTI